MFLPIYIASLGESLDFGGQAVYAGETGEVLLTRIALTYCITTCLRRKHLVL
ncbi:hypothetical protein DYBT9623_01756 [Dyadobacter sp. CECT 9623]|uniref:Uncharacterized protein n=1 Tax=Dyadobacter linearis TaxID=2823330 RepID=A0ABN7R657_9BACT|nr:hypothetical protein DYBT9623_01756 [Dyadobacter sp. CECT 9623]